MSSQERQFLIIDADSKIRAQIRTYLGEMGYRNIIEATRVKEALDILNTTFIDCIIADWDTPGASAYTLLKLMRAQKRFNHVFFILMAKAEATERPEEKIIQSRKLHVDGFLLKPFESKTLEVMLKRVEPNVL